MHRITILQPPYPMHHTAEEQLSLLDWQARSLSEIRVGSTDYVILPENCNCTGYRDKANMLDLIRGRGAQFVKLMQDTARRVGCTVMAGVMTEDSRGALRNQLGVFASDGAVCYPYTKNHLVKPELDKGIVPGDCAKPFEIRGVRFGAAICFDIYFPELFAYYAKERVDAVVIVSHQRQEPGENLDFLTRARAFDCGCTILRSAPAMANPIIGGRSMAVAPDGRILASAGGASGVLTCEVDLSARFMRPASYGEPDRIGDYREVIQPACRPALYR